MTLVEKCCPELPVQCDLWASCFYSYAGAKLSSCIIRKPIQPKYNLCILFFFLRHIYESGKTSGRVLPEYCLDYLHTLTTMAHIHHHFYDMAGPVTKHGSPSISSTPHVWRVSRCSNFLSTHVLVLYRLQSKSCDFCTCPHH